MADANPFLDFIRRIRAGDQEAAAELVHQYESAIRLEVRLRLFDPDLKRAFDSMDICQSVLASFFMRAAAGQFDIDQPADLQKILIMMAQRKLVSRVRMEQAVRRDQRRRDGAPQAELVAPLASPSRFASARDLLAAVQARFSADERQIADLRGAGHSWPEVATMLGGTALGRRKQFARTLNRIAGELGLDEGDDFDDE